MQKDGRRAAPLYQMSPSLSNRMTGDAGRDVCGRAFEPRCSYAYSGVNRLYRCVFRFLSSLYLYRQCWLWSISTVVSNGSHTSANLGSLTSVLTGLTPALCSVVSHQRCAPWSLTGVVFCGLSSALCVPF
ncbi:hypothetical protein Bbelb_334890 [Branchiostoma belcheri]|nr:hypothetical protein Bbelb_334890 [Branchiostoma belcheri]